MKISPICEEKGCMHQQHFTNIRKLQAQVERLEAALKRHGWESIVEDKPAAAKGDDA